MSYSFQVNAYPFDNIFSYLQVIKMLSTICILFAVCWLPIHILNLVISFARDWLEIIYQTDSGYKIYIALTIGAHWFSMANSFGESIKFMKKLINFDYFRPTVNPIIYCFMSENFRVSVILIKLLLQL